MPETEAQPGLLTAPRVLLFAVTTGLMVGNLYYVQPLLAAVAASFHHGVTSAGYLVTATQFGYALGVLLVVPLGDVLDRRGMLTNMLAVNVAALLAAAVSPGFISFAAASLAIGCTSSAAMVVIPYVASKAPDAARGRYLGQVMTGLLLGILLARTVSGFVAEWLGWRAMYFIAAAAVALLLLALRAAIPREAMRGHLAYGRLLRSLVTLVRNEPELRRRSIYNALGLGSFSVLWTGLTFLLSGAPYHYSEATIGLFGLIGAAGAMSANFAGRLGDRGHAHRATGGFAVILLASWVVLAFGGTSIWAVVAGVFLLDVGAQGLHVTHQSVIYRLAPHARARVTAVYMTATFIGASAGSALASASFSVAGWTGLCVTAALLPVVILAMWATGALRRRPEAA
ncbi:MAG: MFS transporter [Acetobacteraceae bacterium]|nr:MFS transporter [Acetobacteraceae bacterium]